MALTPITDHEVAAKGRLAHQFRKPNIEALVGVTAARMQALEDAIWPLIEDRALPSAVGSLLDLIGAIVGQPRSVSGPDATDDEVYRGLIYARIAINTSYGRPEDVYSLLRLLGVTAAWINEPGCYTMQIHYKGTLLVDDDGLLAALTAATGPVTLDVVDYDIDAFGFDGDPDALGFDDGELSRSVA